MSSTTWLSLLTLFGAATCGALCCVNAAAYVSDRLGFVALLNKEVAWAPVGQCVFGFFIMHWYFLFNQARIHINEFAKLPREERKKHDIMAFKRGSTGNAQVARANMLVRNTGEQAIAFFASVWLCANFGSTQLAADLGFLWIFFRCLYHPLSSFGYAAILLSTLPGYCIITVMSLTGLAGCMNL